jgi:hypothetical protein
MKISLAFTLIAAIPRATAFMPVTINHKTANTNLASMAQDSDPMVRASVHRSCVKD